MLPRQGRLAPALATQPHERRFAVGAPSQQPVALCRRKPLQTQSPASPSSLAASGPVYLDFLINIRSRNGLTTPLPVV